MRPHAPVRTLRQYILDTKPNAKIAILYQSDEYGKGYLKLFKNALDDRAASLIIKEVGDDLIDPTIGSQIVTLHESGADTLLKARRPRFDVRRRRCLIRTRWHTC